MKEQLQQRLAELQQEFENGRQRLEGLENESTKLKNTLMRISGAIQVLEEEIKREGAAPKSDAAAAE